jgi:CRP-like cAMP-binding protein
MQAIRDYFESITPLSDDEWNAFSAKLLPQEFGKKDFILEEGKTENYLSFIANGIARFFLFKGEEEITFDFAFTGEFLSGYSSFITQTPASFNIQALSPTALWRISYKDLQEIYTTTNVGNRIGRYAAEQLFLSKSHREMTFLIQSAQERYLNLFTEQPQLLRQIPGKYLASYIGITPQALSRIRKRIY